MIFNLRLLFDPFTYTVRTVSFVILFVQDTSEFHIENAIAYIDQLDKHAPRLTVEETFEFAYQCESGGRMIRSKVDPELEKLVQKADKEHLYTTLVLSALGLAECRKTFVGDDNVRGVSGGQRRRVTVGEVRNQQRGSRCICFPH